MDGALNSSVETDVKPSVGDVKVPLSINVETALSVMRPTKEVLPVLKRDRQDEGRHFWSSEGSFRSPLHRLL